MGCKSSKGISILKASQTGNLKKVEKLLNSGVDVNTKDPENRTLLHYAIQFEHLDIASLLLDRGADVNAIDATDRTALFYACRKDDLAAASLLRSKGARVDVADVEGCCSLHHAAASGAASVMKFLLEQGVDVMLRDKTGDLPGDFYHESVSLEKQREVQAILAPHFQKAEKGNVGVRFTLCTDLESQASVTESEASLSPLDGISLKRKQGALLLAAMLSGNVDRAVELIASGKADLACQDIAGVTPLHLAAKHGHANLCALCVDHGAPVNRQTMRGETPLYLACDSGNADVVDEIVQTLLEAGADPTINTKTCWNPLHASVQRGNYQTLKLLLASLKDEFLGVKEPTVNATTEDGLTPLLLACRAGQPDSVELLLNHQADPERALAQMDNLFGPNISKEDRAKIKETFQRFRLSSTNEMTEDEDVMTEMVEDQSTVDSEAITHQNYIVDQEQKNNILVKMAKSMSAVHSDVLEDDASGLDSSQCSKLTDNETQDVPEHFESSESLNSIENGKCTIVSSKEHLITPAKCGAVEIEVSEGINVVEENRMAGEDDCATLEGSWSLGMLFAEEEIAADFAGENSTAEECSFPIDHPLEDVEENKTKNDNVVPESLQSVGMPIADGEQECNPITDEIIVSVGQYGEQVGNNKTKDDIVTFENSQPVAIAIPEENSIPVGLSPSDARHRALQDPTVLEQSGHASNEDDKHMTEILDKERAEEQPPKCIEDVTKEIKDDFTTVTHSIPPKDKDQQILSDESISENLESGDNSVKALNGSEGKQCSGQQNGVEDEKNSTDSCPVTEDQARLESEFHENRLEDCQLIEPSVGEKETPKSDNIIIYEGGFPASNGIKRIFSKEQRICPADKTQPSKNNENCDIFLDDKIHDIYDSIPISPIQPVKHNQKIVSSDSSPGRTHDEEADFINLNVNNSCALNYSAESSVELNIAEGIPCKKSFQQENNEMSHCSASNTFRREYIGKVDDFKLYCTIFVQNDSTLIQSIS